MAFDPKVFSQIVFQGIYESKRIFNRMNRAYDALVAGVWAKSVDVPLMPQLVVSKAAVAEGHADRKRGSDVSTVNVPFSTYIVPIACVLEDIMATNDQLLNALAAQVVAAFERGLDVDSLAAAVLALPGGNKDIMAGGTMQDVDIMKVLSWFNKKELPDTDRLVIVPTNLEEEFYACPMVKQAMSYNQNLLETGVIKIKNATFIVTALASQVDNKDALQAIWGQSIAAVVKNSGLDRFEAYVAGSGLKVVDYAGYGGAKRIYDNGVFALKHQ